MAIRGKDKKPVGAGLRGGLYLAFLLGRKKSRDDGGVAFAVAAVFEVGGFGQQFPAVSQRVIPSGYSYRTYAKARADLINSCLMYASKKPCLS
ncbi:hypothetical protein GCM10011495_36420 [Hymenobacter frigidus]|uniref:Uncharacterized protein n=1 Tax=Hymenobacter frigidus TaxID=1524095 RepID=A0ABQ2AGU3_9BACT|nr:hypothetical protein GCM10011495_36420 [Hymenobacter frigidus]